MKSVCKTRFVEQHIWPSHNLSEVVNSTSTFFGDLGSIKFNMVGLSVYQSMTCLRSLRFVFQEYQHKLFLLFRFMHQSHLDQKWHFWKHFSFGLFFFYFFRLLRSTVGYFRNLLSICYLYKLKFNLGSVQVFWHKVKFKYFISLSFDSDNGSKPSHYFLYVSSCFEAN